MSGELVYVSAGDTYSVYRDERGNELYLADGPGFRFLVPIEDLDLAESWEEFRGQNGWHNYNGWTAWLRTQVIDPEEVDGLIWCADCGSHPLLPEAGFPTSIGRVCERCDEDYSTCAECDERYNETWHTLHGDNVCARCRDSHYSFCEGCDGWYRNNYADDHEHSDGNCRCVSPAMAFAIRNGAGPLGSDERVTVALPSGVISEEGLYAIANYVQCKAYEIADLTQRSQLYMIGAVNILETDIGATWQTREGNFTKRLSRYAHKRYGLKLAPELVSQVGVIAREHSGGLDLQVEITRDLNLSAAELGNEDSCWWGSYESSRCALKSNGGFAMRTFEAGRSYPSGRAWVLPLKQQNETLTPTFETLTPAAFVVFNGYEDLQGYTGPRVLAHMTGLTYRKISFECSPMYINSGGYLVAGEDIASKYTDGSLSLSVTAHSTLFHTERKDIADVA